MAKIKLTKGQLYFLKERDYRTGEISRYVKIGLVRNEKETEKEINTSQITGYKHKPNNRRSTQAKQ